MKRPTGDEIGAVRSLAPRELPRRVALRWLAAAPAAAAFVTTALGQAEIKTGFEDIDADTSGESRRGSGKAGSKFAECVVKNEKELSRKERANLAENVKGLEEALKTLRDHELPDDVEPAFTFRALRSGGRRP